MALDSIVYGFGSSCNETKNITTMNSIRHHCGPRVSNFGKKKPPQWQVQSLLSWLREHTWWEKTKMTRSQVPPHHGLQFCNFGKKKPWQRNQFIVVMALEAHLMIKKETKSQAPCPHGPRLYHFRKKNYDDDKLSSSSLWLGKHIQRQKIKTMRRWFPHHHGLRLCKSRNKKPRW